jgi:hypothetical protein
MFKPSIEATNGFFTTLFGWNLVNSLVCSGTSTPDFVLDNSILEQSFQAGENLVSE